MTVTPEEFRAARADERAKIAEDVMTTFIQAIRPGQPAWFNGNTHLADLAIDSIQLVELKFLLDQLAGTDLDVNLFIVNPTVHELAANIAAMAT
jgi:acyl carrier protein